MRTLNDEELKQVCGGWDCECDCETQKGNNGYGNGGEDGVPGRSADNDSPNADEKAADEVR